MLVAVLEAGELVGFSSNFVGTVSVLLEPTLNSSVGVGVKMIEDSGSVVSGNFHFRLEFEVDSKNDTVFSDEFVDAAADLK